MHLPKEFKEYADNNGISSMEEFTINHLWNLLGYGGGQIYLSKLTSNRDFLKRVIKEKYPDKTPTELIRALGISQTNAYALWREVHQGTCRDKQISFLD